MGWVVARAAGDLVDALREEVRHDVRELGGELKRKPCPALA